MQRFKKWIFLFVMGLGLNAVHAQTSITLQQALTYALENSEVLEQARLDIENAGYVVQENKAGVYPQISVNSSVTGNPIVPSFVLPAEAFGGEPGEFMAIKAGQTWNAMSQVQLSQQLYNQQVFTGLKAAKKSVEFYELVRKVSEENVIQQVAANFYQVLISRDRIAVVDNNIEQMTQLENMVRGRYENGLAKKIDLNRIKVNKSNLQTERLGLEDAVAQQENLLKYYIGMPITEEITLVSPPVESFSIARPFFEEEPVLTKDLNAFKVLEVQDELLDLQKKAQKAEAYPSLSLDANYLYNTQSDKFNIYSGNALNYDASAIGLTLTIPIFDGNARRSKMRQTEIETQKVRQEMKRTNNELLMNLKNAERKMTISLERIHSQEENKELAQEVFASTQNNYRNGLASLTDLLDAESELVAAQNSYHEALLNYKVAEIELAKAKGKINTLLED